MSYLDDMRALFEDDAPEDARDDGPARGTLETVREQLEDSRHHYLEDPEGTFTTDGTWSGCGYARAVITVDEEGGTCSFDVETGLRVAPENARPVRRMMRMLNNTYIQTGWRLADDGVVHFTSQEPLDVRDGADVDVAVGRVFLTIHTEAWKFTAISAGAKAWDLV